MKKRFGHAPTCCQHAVFTATTEDLLKRCKCKDCGIEWATVLKPDGGTDS
jgi:hypothetical protein